MLGIKKDSAFVHSKFFRVVLAGASPSVAQYSVLRNGWTLGQNMVLLYTKYQEFWRQFIHFLLLARQFHG
jgi:hypothetical protein